MPGVEKWVLENLKTDKEKVKYLLEKYPDARNNDLYLFILYLREFTELKDYIKYIPYPLLKKYAGKYETIRRVRQKLQEWGLYLPTDPKVLKRRRRLAQAWRRVIKEV